jgi:hypothetical protein
MRYPIGNNVGLGLRMYRLGLNGHNGAEVLGHVGSRRQPRQGREGVGVKGAWTRGTFRKQVILECPRS